MADERLSKATSLGPVHCAPICVARHRRVLSRPRQFVGGVLNLCYWLILPNSPLPSDSGLPCSIFSSSLMDKSLDILKKAISKSKFVDKRKHTDTIQEISVLLADVSTVGTGSRDYITLAYRICRRSRTESLCMTYGSLSSPFTQHTHYLRCAWPRTYSTAYIMREY